MNRTNEGPPAPESSSESPQKTERKNPRRLLVCGLLAVATAMVVLGGVVLTKPNALISAASVAMPGGGGTSPADGTSSLGLGSVSTSPGLSSAFKETFTDHYVQANGLRQHVVVGGEGPPLLLIHGWPENWYAWRLVMPALARHYTVIAVDQRGMGLTEKPKSGYDTGTLAKDLASLMDSLGHRRFSVVGHDTGMAIGYALAADYPQRVERVALAEVPGLPGVVPSPPLYTPAALNNRTWHIPFNRIPQDLPEQLVTGREAAFFGYEFTIQGGQLPKEATDYYVRLLSNPESLRGNFGFYRAWDTTLAQNTQRAKNKLTMPVLAIGGAESWGPAVGAGLKGAATNVQTAVIPGAAHWVAEQAPGALVARLTGFLEAGYGPSDAVTTTGK